MAGPRRDARQAAERETLAQKARLAWVKARTEAVHDAVTTYDVLRRFGVNLSKGDDREEQFSCPFHGADRTPSARVYPVSNTGPSHAWCYVCKERWDVISLWRKFNGMGADVKFSQVLASIEKEYGLEVPPLSDDAFLDDDDGVDEALEAFDDLYLVCERRLREARTAYKYFGDMRGFLSAGSMLDKLRHKVDHRLMKPERAVVLLRRLLDKIGEKERSCPEG